MAPFEVIDLSDVDGRNRVLLKAARQVFHDAYAVTTPCNGAPSQILNDQGQPIALGFVDVLGNISFQTVASQGLLN
jgi:hypothetical protein